MMRNINMPSFPSLMVQRYNKIEKQRDFKAPQALSGDTELTARAANVLNSVAKVQQNFEIAKYPRHISQIPHQWPSCRQICDSQRVIAPKNRYFRLFLPCFQTFL